MEFRGTKEKWKIFTNAHKECDGEEWGWIGLNTFNSKSINKCSIHWSGKEAKANALLISKSPEMLEMLQKIVLMTETCNGTFEDFREIYNYEIKQLIKEATEL